MKLENLLLAATLLVAPLSAATPAQEASDPLTTSASITFGDEAIQVLGVEGGVEVLRNGERMPGSRWRLEGDTLEVLDEAGKRLASLSVANLRRNWKALQDRQPKTYIGVVMDTLDAARASVLPEELEDCAYLTYVVPDQPADKAGLRVDDVLLAVDGQRTATVEAVRGVLSRKAPGDAVEVLALRRGKKLELRVELTAPPPVSTDYWALGVPSSTLGYGWGGQTLVWPKASQAWLQSADNYKQLQKTLLDYYQRVQPEALPGYTTPPPPVTTQPYPRFAPPGWALPGAYAPVPSGEAKAPSAGDVEGLGGRLDGIEKRLERIERLLTKLLGDPK